MELEQQLQQAIALLQEAKTQLDYMESRMDAMQQAIAQIAPTPASAERRLLTAAEAAPLLGYPSSDMLRRAIRSGKFRIGIEIVDDRAPGAARPVYKIHLARALEWLALPVHQREVMLGRRRRRAG
ncbi:hypothetical protein [Thermoleptolyngbya sp. M55_K2018_002]|uniref:hypothetical protein n=1 Tax=Thermoleptolyngbya sp. M55_K2018_002 TaxID=2747808 RepID=UPI001A015241|nr:hypothetical protein [Thermoleptolyngbya sp. M55_K2018_002]HIK42128.1 hypothetical protein [Thermoleptolyngbya sp. M55_K2018_002]